MTKQRPHVRQKILQYGCPKVHDGKNVHYLKECMSSNGFGQIGTKTMRGFSTYINRSYLIGNFQSTILRLFLKHRFV
jgi:hypothetical protein